MQRFRHGLDWLRARLWLVPAALSAAALGLAYLMLAYDFGLFDVTRPIPWWLFSGDAGTARDLLSTLLSGMITMTSLAVSITMVVLSLAAGQLGPRLIWNFISDRQIKVVIGLFMGTILYILVVLRSINDQLGPGGVPHVAVTVGSVLSIACLFALLFHVNKLSRAIVSDTIVRQVSNRLDHAISALPRVDGTDDRTEPSAPIGGWQSIALAESGYVQLIDYPALCRCAEAHDVQLCVRIRPGEFAVRRMSYVQVRGAATSATT